MQQADISKNKYRENEDVKNKALFVYSIIYVKDLVLNLHN